MKIVRFTVYLLANEYEVNYCGKAKYKVDIRLRDLENLQDDYREAFTRF